MEKAKEIEQLKQELMVFKVTENINDKNKSRDAHDFQQAAPEAPILDRSA